MPATTVVGSEAATISLSRVNLENTIDFTNATHHAQLTVTGAVEVPPFEPPIIVDVVPVIERCVLDGTNDITKFNGQNAPGQPRRRNRTTNAYWSEARNSDQSPMTVQFSNIPPRDYRVLTALEGYVTVARPTETESIEVAYANGATASTATGWNGEVQGLEAAAPGRMPKGRISITKPGTGSPGALDAPRVVRVEFFSEAREVVGSMEGGNIRPTPDGIVIDFSNIQMQYGGRDAAPPVAVRVEFISAIEKTRVPFSFRDIELTR